MDNTNNTYTPPSADQIKVAAMNQGCTPEGAQTVVEIVREYPDLNTDEVIAEVASAKGKDDKDTITGKLFKKAENEKDKPVKAVKPNNAPLPGTPEYNNR
jgi:hypothetical protein